jgi:hypothetical protein
MGPHLKGLAIFNDSEVNLLKKTLKSKNVVLSTLESLKQGTLIEGDGSVQLTSLKR